MLDNLEYPTNLMLLREINKISMDNLIYNAGEIRTLPVSIGGTSWTPEMPNQAVIIEELDKLNKMEDKLDCALETFCYIARTQMFLDGNKRLAQLIANKVMIEHDLGILSVPYDKIPTFKEKLVSFYETGDNADFKKFLMDYCLLLNPERREIKASRDSEQEHDEAYDREDDEPKVD
jgi:Fic family protein